MNVNDRLCTWGGGLFIGSVCVFMYCCTFCLCSLSALSDVLNALAEHRSHVPYRNSTLTHLLKDSIGMLLSKLFNC